MSSKFSESCLIVYSINPLPKTQERTTVRSSKHRINEIKSYLKVSAVPESGSLVLSLSLRRFFFTLKNDLRLIIYRERGWETSCICCEITGGSRSVRLNTGTRHSYPSTRQCNPADCVNVLNTRSLVIFILELSLNLFYQMSRLNFRHMFERSVKLIKNNGSFLLHIL